MANKKSSPMKQMGGTAIAGFQFTFSNFDGFNNYNISNGVSAENNIYIIE